ncbi:MAG: hypothetical protein ABI589_07790, partial [Burkholderiales bacterium]
IAEVASTLNENLLVHSMLAKATSDDERLNETKIDNYDFVNGAPAVGASLDLQVAPEMFKQIYGRRKQKKNLHSYFTEITLPNIVVPNRRYFTTNDPVMTPQLLDYFFNEQTQVFANLDDRKKVLLRSIYDTPAYAGVLPAVDAETQHHHHMRQHQRYALKCPGMISVSDAHEPQLQAFEVLEVSKYGFQAASQVDLPLNVWCDVTVQLGRSEKSFMKAMALRESVNGVKGWYAFKLAEPDLAWRKLVNALRSGETHADLENATAFTAVAA